MDVETLRRLKTALAGRDSIDIGHFHWVNLDMVKAEAGERWKEMSRRIYDVAGHFIEKRLNPNDVLLRFDGGFILILAELKGMTAEQQVEKISQDLNLFFLGDRILSQLEIKSHSRAVSARDLEGLVRAAAATPRPPAPAKAKRPPMPAEDLEAYEAGKAGWQAFEAGHHSLLGAPTPHSDDVSRDSTGLAGMRSADEEPESSAASGAGYVVRAERARMAAGLPKAVFTEPDELWDDIVFSPCWDASSEHITVNFCQARRFYRGKVLYGRDTLLGYDKASLHRKLDRSVAVAALRGFQQAYAAGHKTAVAIPVNYETVLGAADRVSYFSLLQGVPQHVRKFFFLRIDNIPPGAPPGQMEEVFRSMKWFGSNTLAKVPLGTRDLQKFQNCGVSQFGSELGKFGPDGPSDEDIHKLSEQAKAAHALHARSFLTQVTRMDAFNAGISAGFSIFTGTVIGPETPLPVPLTPLGFDHIMRRAA